MIDATTLRLGNWICKDGEYIQVNDINQYGDDGQPKINGWDEEDFAPIKLSEYWLERYGKVFDGDSKEWQYQIQVGALKWFFRWNTEWYSELGGIYIGSQVQYFHQLQNIIHDLTGKEITIKEPIDEDIKKD